MRALRSGKAQDREKSGFANYFISVLTDRNAKGKKNKEAEIEHFGQKLLFSQSQGRKIKAVTGASNAQMQS